MGAPSGRDTLVRFLKAHAFPLLRSSGFTCSGQTCRQKFSDFIFVINFESAGKHMQDMILAEKNLRDTFTVNLGVYFSYIPEAIWNSEKKQFDVQGRFLANPKEYECHARIRLNRICPGMGEWLPYGRNEAELEKRLEETTEHILAQGIPWLVHHSDPNIIISEIDSNSLVDVRKGSPRAHYMLGYLRKKSGESLM